MVAALVGISRVAGCLYRCLSHSTKVKGGKQLEKTMIVAASLWSLNPRPRNMVTVVSVFSLCVCMFFSLWVTSEKCIRCSLNLFLSILFIHIRLYRCILFELLYLFLGGQGEGERGRVRMLQPLRWIPSTMLPRRRCSGPSTMPTGGRTRRTRRAPGWSKGYEKMVVNDG